MNQGQEFPFILVSPQCPSGQWWTWPQLSAALSHLLDEVESTYAVDPERIYVTGLSMGGFGTWSLAIASPHRFAAIVPICGSGGKSRSDQRYPLSSCLGLSWRPGCYRSFARHVENGQRLKGQWRQRQIDHLSRYRPQCSGPGLRRARIVSLVAQSAAAERGGKFAYRRCKSISSHDIVS